jgi:hypothetical protein
MPSFKESNAATTQHSRRIEHWSNQTPNMPDPLTTSKLMSIANSRTLLLVIAWLAAALPMLGDEPAPPLGELLKEYQELGLPLPPKDAKLVRYRGDTSQSWSVAFQTKPGNKTELAEYFADLRRSEVGWDQKSEPIEPDSAFLKDARIDSDDAFLLAIHCQARGWADFAKQLLQRSQQDAKEAPRKRLIQLAWSYWEGELFTADTDRTAAGKRLKALIKQDKELDTERNQELLKLLDQTLVPTKAKAGTVDALIDDLVNYTGNVIYDHDWVFKPDDRFSRVARLGFAAVPALIDHLEDRRLTRVFFVPLATGPVRSSFPIQVCDVVSNLLESLAGEPLGDHHPADPTSKEAALKWWQKAREMGEEKYVVEHVFLKKPPEWQNQMPHLNYIALNLAVAKYPQHIPELYRIVVDRRPNIPAYQLAEALLLCKIPEKEKLDAFLHASECKMMELKLAALRGIEQLDKGRYKSILLETLEQTPRAELDAGWTDTDMLNIALMAAGCDEPQVWSMLEKVIKRSTPNWRLRMLGQVAPHVHYPPADAPQRLRFLAKFLGDTGSGDYGGHKNLEVRNLVAPDIAAFLGPELKWDVPRSGEDWAKFREAAAKMLKAELDKPQE